MMTEMTQHGKNIVIVSRHLGAIEWLRRRGIIGEIITHATPENIKGRIPVGTLPMHLAARVPEVWSLEIPDVPPHRRGHDLTPEEMDRYGARLVRYSVQYLGVIP